MTCDSCATDGVSGTIDVHLSELRNPLGLLENNSGVIVGSGPGRLALVHDPGVRPVGYAWAVATSFLVTHHVSPFCPVHVSMRVGKWRIVRVERTVMTRPDEVSDLVCDRVR